MMTLPEMNPILNQWILLYDEYPLLRHFKILDVIQGADILNIPFHFKDQSEQINHLSDKELSYALDYLNQFLSKQDTNFRYLLAYDINEITSKFIPERKKIKALWNLQLKDLNSVCNAYFFAVAKQLIQKGFNPDLLLNQLEELLSNLGKTYRHDLGANVLFIDNLKIKNSVIHFLQDFYNDRRIVRLFFYGYLIKGESSEVVEIDRLVKELKILDIQIQEDCMPEKPKTFSDVFRPLAACFDEGSILKNDNFTLKVWDRLKHFNNKKTNILNVDYSIQIPQSRHELVTWGRRFQNCVGYKEEYIQQIQANDGIMFFIMKDNYPMFCVYYNEDTSDSEKFRFETKCMHNDNVYPEEYDAIFEVAKKLYSYDTIINKIKTAVMGNKQLVDGISFISKFSF